MNLVIDSLSAGYNGCPVLKDISLEVKQGGICALMGRNGSGKTTLLRCINAILKPMQGRIMVNGKGFGSLSRIEIARLISLVPQGIYTAFSFSCLEMVLMGSVSRIKAWKAPDRFEVKKALEILDEIGIESLAQRPFNHISGGERQMVMLARALFQDAPIMLMDEPNTHLDFSNQHRVMKLAREVVKRRGATALLSIHDPNLVLYYCDEVAMLKDGHMIASGPVAEVMKISILQQTLGENIQMDVTVTGLPVVTPRLAI